MEAKIENKMRLDKCDAGTAKETPGYGGRKSYVSAAAKSEEKQRWTEEETSLQINYRSPPPNERRDELTENQNRENEAKDSDNHRKETE